jgi:phospholipid transport system substrate-binding protein
LKKFFTIIFLLNLSFKQCLFYSTRCICSVYRSIELLKFLSKNISREEKIAGLKIIAKETVDIRGVGFYSLGSARKVLNDNQIEKYFNLFENYFLKSFSSRLSEYTNPKIQVQSKDVISKNYTIVNSVLVSTPERPEVKIDWRIYTKRPDESFN